MEAEERPACAPLAPMPPPPPLPVSPLMPSSPTTSKKKMSNACELDLQRVARNKETDSNIFALGEAVSQLDIDDVLSGVGSDLTELFNADDGSVTTMSCRLPISDLASLKPSPTADKFTTMQVLSHSASATDFVTPVLWFCRFITCQSAPRVCISRFARKERHRSPIQVAFCSRV